MSATEAQAARTAALRSARTADSQAKRARALAAIEALESAGTLISFPAVAKAAGVSTWLAYSSGIREHVEAARRRQTDAVGSERSTSPAAPQRTSAAGLRTDLALARSEIGRLRAEADQLRQRLRLHLGAEIESSDHAGLIARAAELEAVNRQLVVERDARAGEAESAARRVGELEDELAAVRESLRRVMRAENRGR
ncbi:MAG: DUF6262 family protein [Actinomycetota bacterium]|nr:DUF6262 family protein [Actinomycetota bacterium]